MNQRLSDAVLGAVAGVIGAGGMTVLRMVAHRAGLIDRMVPQAVEHALERGAGERAPVAGARATDQALHLGYGLAAGALYGATIDRPSRAAPHAGRALAYGAAVWAFGSMVLLPGLRIARPAWRRGLAENAVDLAAHLAYAGITAFVAGEFARQEEESPRAGHPDSPARVG
jgi:hypothetical protein